MKTDSKGYMTLKHGSNKKIAYNIAAQSPEVTDLKRWMIIAIKFLLCNTDPRRLCSLALSVCCSL